jgi:NitT/TauT family transport system permease protein
VFYQSNKSKRVLNSKILKRKDSSVEITPGKKKSLLSFISPLVVILCVLLLWYIVCLFRFFPEYALPSPGSSLRGLREVLAGTLIKDIIASLWRVCVGFVISAALGIPAGLWLGQNASARRALVPLLQFFRFISPLAWIPFAILWFRIGDLPAIFLIFMATFFLLTLSTMSAVANIPTIYFRVASDYNYTGMEKLAKVILPAVLPQVITALRVSYGIAWVVIVAAEMVGCQDGLGYGIWNARNGLRLDIAVAYMITIGLLGVAIDRLLAQLTKQPSIRWHYES